MSVLKSIETRLADLVEGTFSRAFKSEVRPVEIARRLAREMDQNRAPFVSRVYVPSSYSVYLSPADWEKFGPHEQELRSELASYLLEHARRENLTLAERPRIAIASDERLGLGEFGIRTDPDDTASIGDGDGRPEHRSGSARAATPAPAIASPPPPVSPPATRASSAAASRRPAATGSARVVAAGMAVDLDEKGMVLGRSRDCDIVLEDPNASRRHVRIVRAASGEWMLDDLGSTNGVLLNGSRVAGSSQLANGDRIKLGQTELTFETG